MTRADEFLELRPLLFSIAYRLLSSVADAEDAVQETWLRYEAAAAEPQSPKAYLSTVVTRVAIDVLRSARRSREAYVGPWFPEPLVDDPYEDPERAVELADSLSMAALLLLERLTPLERAVFVLREVFGFSYAEVAAAVNRTEPACRQLVVRARRHVGEGRRRFHADRTERHELADRFFEAFSCGDVAGLRTLLAEDVAMVSDSGGKAPQWGTGVFGADRVTRLLAAVVPPFLSIGGTVQRRLINGEPGAVVCDPDGRILTILALDVLDGRIQTVRSVANPDKLTHLGPVADAYEVLRLTREAQRGERA